MKKLYYICFFIPSILIAQWGYAALENGRLYLPFKNNGILAAVNLQPKGSNMQWDDIGVLFSGGFFLSGYSNDELFTSGMASSELFETYIQGTLSNIDSATTKIYSVKKSDPPFGEAWSDWKNAVKLGAYYYDGDGNGIYDPIDHNRNGFWEVDEDKPGLMYDQTFFNVFSDRGNFSDPRIHYSKGIEIKQTIFASSDSLLNHSVFIRYSIVNRGTVNDTLKDMVFSIYADADIGYHKDDLTGCDTLLNSGFTYNHGPDSLFGENPPAVFFTILQGPAKYTGNIDDTAKVVFNDFSAPVKLPGFINTGLTAHTTSRIEGRFWAVVRSLRNLMLGKLSDGELINPCQDDTGEIFGIDCSEVNPKFWFSGDPVAKSGWLNILPNDQRSIISTGTFNLIKDEPQDIIVAYTIGQGNDNLSSIIDGKNRVRKLFEIYENNFTGSFELPDYNVIYPKEFHLSQNYPNPFNPNTKIKYTIPGVGDENFRPLQAQLIVYDILGRKVTTLVDEPKAPGNYEITFDASRLASGVYLYRLTSGSFSQTKKMMVIK